MDIIDKLIEISNEFVIELGKEYTIVGYRRSVKYDLKFQKNMPIYSKVKIVEICSKHKSCSNTCGFYKRNKCCVRYEIIDTDRSPWSCYVVVDGENIGNGEEIVYGHSR